MSGVSIQGGYAGCGAANPDERDIETFETILSGDFERNDNCLPEGEPPSSNCCSAHAGVGCDDPVCGGAEPGDPSIVCNYVDASDPDPQNWIYYNYCCVGDWDAACANVANMLCVCVCFNDDSQDNSYHVVSASGPAASTTLDGVTITGGNANGSETRGSGAGLYCDSGDLTLNNCTVRDNAATERGAGLYLQSGNATVTGCNFHLNATGEHGGGLYAQNGSITLGGCTLQENTAGEHGGGVYVDEGGVTLTGCAFQGNTAGSSSNGGGLYLSNTHGYAVSLTNCSFSQNSAGISGGAIYNVAGNATLSGCVFNDNNYASTYGGAVFVLGAESPDPSSHLSMSGCTFSGNRAGYGAGLALQTHATATVADCTFSSHDTGIAVFGGAIFLDDFSHATFDGVCTFDQNIAPYGGAGALHNGSAATFHGSVFTSNQSDYDGGAMFISAESEASFYDCTFNGNVAYGTEGGGALFVQLVLSQA